MKTITLQFSYQHDLGADLITYFGHGAGFSHVDVVIPKGEEKEGWLLGARSDVCKGVKAGVQVRPPDYAKFTRWTRIDIPTGDANAEAFWAFLAAQIGKPYDMPAIIGFALGRNWREPDSWFCSELQATALETARVFPYALATPANKIDPDDLMLALSAIVKIGA